MFYSLPLLGQDKCHNCFTLALPPLQNSRISRVWSIGTVTMPCLQRIVSILISGLGIHVVPLALRLRLTSWSFLDFNPFAWYPHTLSENASLDRRLPLLFFRSPDVFVLRRRHLCAESFLNGSSSLKWSSPLLVVLKKSSLYSPPSPPERP